MSDDAAFDAVLCDMEMQKASFAADKHQQKGPSLYISLRCRD